MIYLSKSAMMYAVNICNEFPGYKVGVAVNKMSDVAELVASIAIMLNDVKTRINGLDKCIMFPNGSLIRFIPGRDCSKGYAFHLLVADKNIDFETLSTALIPTEKIDYHL